MTFEVNQLKWLWITWTTPFGCENWRLGFNYLDTNKNGTVSRDDFDLFADKLVLYGKLDESKDKSVRARVLRIWEGLGLPDDVVATEKEFLNNAANTSGMFYFDYLILIPITAWHQFMCRVLLFQRRSTVNFTVHTLIPSIVTMMASFSEGVNCLLSSHWIESRWRSYVLWYNRWR